MRKPHSHISLWSFAVALGLCGLYSIAGSAQGTAGGIHRIDFRNFLYYPECLNWETPGKVSVKTINGSYSKKESGDTDEMSFEVRDVVYGDLNGDGMDEAIVLTDCNTGGPFWVNDGLVFGMQKGRPTIISHIEGGNRANGGVRAARVDGGLLKVERLGSYSSSRAIGADFTETTTYRLRGTRLLQVGRPSRRPLRGENRAKRIQFERGKSSMVLTGTTSGADFYVLRARDDQTLTVRITSPLNNARFEIITGDFTMAYRKTEWSGKLGFRDCHIVVVSDKGSAEYRLEVTVR